MNIPTDKIRDVIGSGGKVIREIVEKTGAKINIEDDGTVKIASSNCQGNRSGEASGFTRSLPSLKLAKSTKAQSSRPLTSALSSISSDHVMVWSTSPSSLQRAGRQDLRRGQGRPEGLGQAHGL
jgi:hypothetical protein